MHYYTQILFIILICFLSPLLPPHMFPSLWTFLFTFSCSPFRVFCLKKNQTKNRKEKEEKRFSWKAEVIFCLSASCLPAVQICCYFVPMGQSKFLQWKSKTIGAGQSRKSLVTKVELGKSLASWESLRGQGSHKHPGGQLQGTAEGKAYWDLFLFLEAQAPTKGRTGEGLPFPWLWCLQ